MSGEWRREEGCIFCQIADGATPARYEHQLDAEGNLILSERLVVFHNRLDWARVMLLIVPRDHMTQAELWTTGIVTESAMLGTTLGGKLCPEGYRLLSNFGRPAHQSQEHAHLHLVSGPDPDLPEAFDGKQTVLAEQSGVRITAARVPGAPLAARITFAGAATQHQLWRDERFLECGRAAIAFASERTPEGFRLVSNFHSPATGRAGGGDAALLLLGGGPLDLYA